MKGTDPATPVSAVMASKLARRSRLPVDVVVEGGAVVDVRPRPFDGPAPVAMVMAGGRGKRLRPYTDKVPKPLLKVGESTIIERIMGDLAAAGVSDIYLALNYKAKMFERRLAHVEKHVGARVHFLLEDSPLGTAGALSLLPERPAGEVLVTNADIVTRLQYARLFEYHRAHAGWATMTAVEHVTQIPYGVLRTRGDRLTAQEEKPEVRVRCNAGMYVLAPEVLDLVKPAEYLDMPTLLDRVIDRDHAVHVFPVVERWIDSGTPEEFERVLIQFATGEEE
jgi:NDP-sugar pyrophosphorylase family protein